MSDQAGPIVAELKGIADRFFSIVPELVAALAILIVGWLIARLLRAVTVRFAGIANRTIARFGVRLHSPIGGVRESTARVVGEIRLLPATRQ